MRKGAPVWVMDSSHWIKRGPGAITRVEASKTFVSAPQGPNLMPVSGLRGGGHTHRLCDCTRTISTWNQMATKGMKRCISNGTMYYELCTSTKTKRLRLAVMYNPSKNAEESLYRRDRKAAMVALNSLMNLPNPS